MKNRTCLKFLYTVNHKTWGHGVLAIGVWGRSTGVRFPYIFRHTGILAVDGFGIPHKNYRLFSIFLLRYIEDCVIINWGGVQADKGLPQIGLTIATGIRGYPRLQ